MRSDILAREVTYDGTIMRQQIVVSRNKQKGNSVVFTWALMRDNNIVSDILKNGNGKSCRETLVIRPFRLNCSPDDDRGVSTKREINKGQRLDGGDINANHVKNNKQCGRKSVKTRKQ